MLNTTSRDFGPQPVAQTQQPRSRKSWTSSSGGDTSYYDARDHMTGEESAADYFDAQEENGGNYLAFDGVETSQDLDAAHERAAAFYDNAAYLHENGNDHNVDNVNNGTLKAPGFSKKKFKQQQKKKTRLPYHVTAETNVDSTTTADDEEAGEDDFGFKYRPEIPPPRPLQVSPGKQPPVQSSLTLEDALSMKRSQSGGPPQPPATAAIMSSGILLETNIDSEIDDNSSIPSSYYPDAIVKQPQLQANQTGGSKTFSPPPAGAPQQQVPQTRVAAFQFNTAVREEDETLTEVPTTPVNDKVATSRRESNARKARTSSSTSSSSTATQTATEVAAAGNTWSRSSAAAIAIPDEIPRMATWSSRSQNSPSLTVIEARTGNYSTVSPYKSPTATSVSMSTYSQVPPVVRQQQQQQLSQQSQQSRRQPPPPRMMARLDTDFEVSTDEADFTETTPGDMAILEYSRALEEADRMRHAAAGNYVFAQPPGSHQFAGSVPEYINYTGRDSTTIGSIGLRAKSMNTLNNGTLNTLSSSRNSLKGSNKVLLTPGRARRASLRRSRLGLPLDGEGGGGGIYAIRIEDSNPALNSGSSFNNFANLSSQVELVPEVQHHGPLKSSTAAKPSGSGPLACCQRCADSCCPNTPRKTLIRWLIAGGIVACCILLGVAIAVIVVTTRPNNNNNPST